MNIKYFMKKSGGGAHAPVPDTPGDAYTNAPPIINDNDVGTSIPTWDKRYDNLPGNRITLEVLLEIYPNLKEKLKEMYKLFPRVNYKDFDHV